MTARIITKGNNNPDRSGYRYVQSRPAPILPAKQSLWRRLFK